MKTSVAGMLVGVGVGLLLLGALVGPASAQTPVTACGTFAAAGANTSLILTADLVYTGTPAAGCLVVTGNGASINLNGHSIRGAPGAAAGILAVTPGNNMTIKGPGIIHDFDVCLAAGAHALVQDVLVYNCGRTGITLGAFSKCVECRVHDVRSSEGEGVGITMGLGCLLESSIVERSDIGAIVGPDCKVWDLVVDTVAQQGLIVGPGTSVARTVISHYHDGPGLVYACGNTGIGGAFGCQDSSNSVTVSTSASAIGILSFGSVTTDCATNNRGVKYTGFPLVPVQCPF